MKPITFHGQTFTEYAEFCKAFPAYVSCIELIRKGHDTAHKVELAVYARRKKAKRKGKKIAYSIRRKVA